MIIILADNTDPHLPAANASFPARRRVMTGPASAARRPAGSLLPDPRSRASVRRRRWERRNANSRARLVCSEAPLRWSSASFTLLLPKRQISGWKQSRPQAERVEDVDPHSLPAKSPGFNWFLTGEEKSPKLETSDLISMTSILYFLHVFHIWLSLPFQLCNILMLQKNSRQKKKREKNKPLPPQGQYEGIFEGTELWEFSVKAFQNYSSSSSLNTPSLVACWMERIPPRCCSAV